MADDYFDAKLALNPTTGNVVAGASALVYAADDLSFVTPLAITDLQGIPLAALIASPTGVYPPFKVADEPEKVLAKSGTMITPLTSVNGSKGPKGDPGDAGTGLPAPGGLANGSVPVVQNGAWTTIIGGAGGSAREIQLQATSTQIQWRYVGDSAWTNLVALTDLTGKPGAPGSNGDSVQMRVNNGYFQYKLTKDSTWTNLIAVSEIGGGGAGFVEWTGTAWPGRPSTSAAVMYVSTKDKLAPMPSSMLTGDMWIRHPDAVEAL